MEQAAAAHGVRSEGSVAGEVAQERKNTQESVDSAQEKVNKQKAEVGKQYNNLEQEHQVQGRRFDEANKAEHLRQDTVFNLPKKGQEKQALDDAMNEFKGK